MRRSRFAFSPKQGLFNPPKSVHLYSEKLNAFQHQSNDPHYGRKRAADALRRLLRNRPAMYYAAMSSLVMLGGGGYLWQMQRQRQSDEGLVGPRRPHRSRLTIVLDLDETLVSYGDKAFRLRAGLVPRPFLVDLLDYLVEIDAEVIVWSACSRRYMQQALAAIDPDGVRVTKFISREGYWYTSDDYYEKNIAWLKRDPDSTLIIENRPLSVRNCNSNAILVDDFIRAEYMDTGKDFPANDQALRVIRDVIKDLENSGEKVSTYLSSTNLRNKAIKEIPCHLAFRQLPEELARGVFYFVGDKYQPTQTVSVPK